jgi:AcrR family transcriptional regulator
MAQGSAGVDNRRTDTRERILSVALRMFATQGYANTSLREIADELGVTKAALYFHFKTKDDILGGILQGHLDRINAMIDEGGPRPDCGELLRRLSEYQATRSTHLMRLIRENFTEISNLPFGAELKIAHHRLMDTLAGPGATTMDRVRARTAFFAIQSAAMATADGEDETAAREAALAVALEVLGGCSPRPT